MVPVKDLVANITARMIEDGYGQTAKDINGGNCDIFADLLAKSIAISHVVVSENFGVREISSYFEDYEDSGMPLQRAEVLRDLPDMIPPSGLSWDQLDVFIEHANLGWGLHVFVVFDGKAYDSETPDGVFSFFDLPVFQRLLSVYEAKHGPLNEIEASSTSLTM